MPTQADINYIYKLCLKGDIHQLNITKLAEHFTIGEFFKGIPPGKLKEIKKEHIFNLYNTANILEKLRKSVFKNKKIIISAQGGWRDRYTQLVLIKKGNGARKSQHELGKAVDFNVVGMNPREVQLLLRLAKVSYTRGLGATFTHLDTRIGIGEFNYG